MAMRIDINNQNTSSAEQATSAEDKTLPDFELIQLSKQELRKIHQDYLANTKKEAKKTLLYWVPKKKRSLITDEVIQVFYKLMLDCHKTPGMFYAEKILAPGNIKDILEENWTSKDIINAFKHHREKIRQWRKSRFSSFQKRKLGRAAKKRVSLEKQRNQSNEGLGTDKRVFYRIKQNKETHIRKKIAKLLNKKGYKIIDYHQGYATKADNPKQTFKIGKLLLKLSSSLFREFRDDPTRKDLLFVVSKSPKDIAMMSTNRAWTSCMTSGKSFSRKFVHKEIKKGSMVAYLLKPSDVKIRNPISRVMIRPYIPFTSYEGHNFLDTIALNNLHRNKAYKNRVSAFFNALSFSGSYVPKDMIKRAKFSFGILNSKLNKPVLYPTQTAYGLDKTIILDVASTWASTVYTDLQKELKENGIEPDKTVLFKIKGPYSDGNAHIHHPDIPAKHPRI